VEHPLQADEQRLKRASDDVVSNNLFFASRYKSEKINEKSQKQQI
jgi:hypothetical protein